MPNDEWYDEHYCPPICSVKQMLDLLKELEGKYKKSSIYFRGEQYRYPLLPAIGRKQKFCGEQDEFNLESEVNLLHRFRRWAYLELKRPVSEWEALFLGRHHMLPVRLLDWTSNPLFALYFACEYKEPPVDDAAVWVIVKDGSIEDIDVLEEEWEPRNETNKEDYYQDWDKLPNDMKERYEKDGFSKLPKPFKLKGVRILYPFYATPRMNAQQSFFTIQDNPWMSLEDYCTYRIDDLANRPLQIKKLIKCKVLKDDRKKIIKELVRIGIHNQLLYPDLDGLAKGLWQIEVVRGWNESLLNSASINVNSKS